jgi:hypothetical protein
MKDGDGFRKLEWQLFCDSKTRARLVFADELDKDATGTRIVAMTVGSEKPPQFARFPARVGPYEVWTAAITLDAVKNLFAVPRLGMGQSTQLPARRPRSFSRSGPTVLKAHGRSYRRPVRPRRSARRFRVGRYRHRDHQHRRPRDEHPLARRATRRGSSRREAVDFRPQAARLAVGVALHRRANTNSEAI